MASHKGLLITALAIILVLAWAMMISRSTLFERDEGSSFSDANKIPDLSKSWAVFGSLDAKDEKDWYVIPVTSGTGIKAELRVPKKETGFRPALALVGPGIDGTLGEDLPSGSGAAVVSADDEDYTDVSWDRFTFTRYRTGPTMNLTVPQDGEYHLVVFSEDGKSGEYVLHIGDESKIEIFDVLKSFGAWFRIQWRYWT